MTPSAVPSGPLVGLRVLDLTRLLPGGYCTQLLADLGAEVVKVEAPPSGDGMRDYPPMATTGESAAHLVLNRGKRSVVLDLKQPAGTAALRALVSRSDVLVESFRPGVMERLGLGREALLELNPALVYVAITAYGAQGPYAQRPGHDINAQATAGALSLGAGPSGGPAVPYVQLADMTAGMQAAFGALAALYRRDHGPSGAGQAVDVAMTDAVASLLVVGVAGYGATGRAPTSAEMLTGALACYTTYRCSDGRFVAVGALEPKFFARLCELLERPDLARLQFDLSAQRDLQEQLAEVFAARSRADWTRLLADDDTCVTPVLDVGEALADPNLRGRGVVHDVTLADGSTFPVVGPAARFSVTPGAPGGAAPALGEGGDALLRPAEPR